MGVLDVQKGIDELKQKSMVDIEKATAQTWGGRAAASYQLATQAGETAQRMKHFYEGENYRQEALEHASMAEDGGKLLMQVHDEIADYRRRAADALKIKP